MADSIARVRRAATLALVTGIIALSALYLIAIGPYWNISPDSASYVGWGQSLAAGAGWGSPPFQPPLTAWLFAAVLRVFPHGYLALNALTPLLILGSLACAYALLVRRGDRNTALLAVLCSLAALPLLHATTQLLSEPGYLLATFGALWLLDRRDAGPRWAEWLGGSLLVAAALSRTVGGTLALAVLAGEALSWWRTRRRPRMVRSAFALAALATIPLWENYSKNEYAHVLVNMFRLRDQFAPEAGILGWSELVERIGHNAVLLPSAGRMLLNELGAGVPALRAILPVAALLLILAGLVRACRARIGLTELYVLGFSLITTAYATLGSAWEAGRLFVPVLPLLFWYAFEAMRGLWHAWRWRFAVVALGALYFVGYLPTGWAAAVRVAAEAHASPFGDYPIKRPENFDAQELALWLRTFSRPEDRYASPQRDMYDVLSGRRGDDIPPGYTFSRTALLELLERRRIRYLMVDRSGLPVGDSLQALVAANPGRFHLVRELPAANLYLLVPASR